MMTDQSFLQDRLNLGTSLNAVMADLPAGMADKVAGLCVYNAVGADDIAVVANMHGPASDQDHKDFLSRRILDSRIPLAGTSVQASLREAGTVSSQRSGYRPDQLCMNMRLGAGTYSRPPSTISIIFDQSAGVEAIDTSAVAEIETMLPNIVETSGLDMQAVRFEENYGARLDTYIELGEGRPKDAFLLYCDLSGSTPLGAHYGFPGVYEYLRFMGQEIYDIAGRNNGYGVRADGDDVVAIFPCTDLPDAEKEAFFEGAVLRAVSDIDAWYEAFKASLTSKEARRSRLMMAASYGVHRPVRLYSRFNDLIHDGEPFYRVSELMKSMKGLSQKERVQLLKSPALVVDETVMAYAPKAQFKAAESKKFARNVIVQDAQVWQP